MMMIMNERTCTERCRGSQNETSTTYLSCRSKSSMRLCRVADSSSPAEELKQYVHRITDRDRETNRHRHADRHTLQHTHTAHQRYTYCHTYSRKRS